VSDSIRRVFSVFFFHAATAGGQVGRMNAITNHTKNEKKKTPVTKITAWLFFLGLKVVVGRAQHCLDNLVNLRLKFFHGRRGVRRCATTREGCSYIDERCFF
jgi:hypothetical protein